MAVLPRLKDAPPPSRPPSPTREQEQVAEDFSFDFDSVRCVPLLNGSLGIHCFEDGHRVEEWIVHRGGGMSRLWRDF